jgi:uncharacterized DUF497 family protein
MKLMIVHIAPNEDTVRIISARRADRKETGYYFDGISHE